MTEHKLIHNGQAIFFMYRDNGRYGLGNRKREKALKDVMIWILGAITKAHKEENPGTDKELTILPESNNVAGQFLYSLRSRDHMHKKICYIEVDCEDVSKPSAVIKASNNDVDILEYDFNIEFRRHGLRLPKEKVRNIYKHLN